MFSDWLAKYWIAFSVGILFPLWRWVSNKLKHQDRLTRDVEELKSKVSDMDDKFDKFCEDQREYSRRSDERDMKLMQTLSTMQVESLNRHMELKQDIASVSKETAINKARLENN